MSFVLLTGDKLSDRNINIPSDVLAKAAGADFSAKVAIVAYLGETGPAQKIGIEQVTLQGNTLTVRVHTKSARPGDMEAMMLTHPSDYVVIDRAAVDMWGGVKVIFTDQTGRVLDRQHLTINHHR